MIVLCAVSVSIVTLNGLLVIVFLRERSLRKRHMYLVINLTVADLLAGGFSSFILFDDLINPCLKWEIFLWFPIGNLATILFGLAVFFVLSFLANLAAFSRNVSSIYASSHEKESLWSSYCRRLVFSGDIAGCGFPYIIIRCSVALRVLHVFIFILLSSHYPCFLRVYRC